MVFDQRRAFVVELHHRHTPAAAGLDACHRDIENLPGPGKQGELTRQLVPFGIGRQYRAARAIDPQDQRGLLEVAHHDSDAPVGQKMRIGLIPRTAKIKVGDPVRRDHAKGIVAFGRKIDSGIGGGGSNEKDALPRNHRDMIVSQRFGKIGHAVLLADKDWHRKPSPLLDGAKGQLRMALLLIAHVPGRARHEHRIAIAVMRQIGFVKINKSLERRITPLDPSRGIEG